MGLWGYMELYGTIWDLPIFLMTALSRVSNSLCGTRGSKFVIHVAVAKGEGDCPRPRTENVSNPGRGAARRAISASPEKLSRQSRDRARENKMYITGEVQV